MFARMLPKTSTGLVLSGIVALCAILCGLLPQQKRSYPNYPTLEAPPGDTVLIGPPANVVEAKLSEDLAKLLGSHGANTASAAFKREDAWIGILVAVLCSLLVTLALFVPFLNVNIPEDACPAIAGIEVPGDKNSSPTQEFILAPIDPQWPDMKSTAFTFVLLLDEGRCDYGARYGFWRILRNATAQKISAITIFTSAAVLRKCPAVAEAIRGLEWELAMLPDKSWIDLPCAEAADRCRATADEIHQLCGRRPAGIWLHGFAAAAAQVIVAAGGFAYEAGRAGCGADLPFRAPHLVLPVPWWTQLPPTADEMQRATVEDKVDVRSSSDRISKVQLRLQRVKEACEQDKANVADSFSTLAMSCAEVTPDVACELSRFLITANSTPSPVWNCRMGELAGHFAERISATSGTGPARSGRRGGGENGSESGSGGTEDEGWSVADGS